MVSDIDSGNKVIQSLWIGERLSLLEQMCINSFLMNGHEFHLYIYEDVRGIPDGTTVKDANQILSKGNYFTCTSPRFDDIPYTEELSKSCAGFSNLFRYKLLRDKGGWWSDTDSVCVKPFDFEDEYVISSGFYGHGGRVVINGAPMKLPMGCEFASYCYNEARKVIEARREKGEEVIFGETGSRILNRVIPIFGLEKHVKSVEVFNPIPWWDGFNLIDPELSWKLPDNYYTVHLSTEIWKVTKTDKDRIYDRRSFYGSLQEKYLPVNFSI